ncbi:MAG TPA: hypothetical protein OIM49_03090 [Clostridiaceae bacterium]|nr:hypothetical protein [Clostridiaceae bacterium]
MKVKKKVLKFSVCLLLIMIMLMNSVSTSISILSLSTYTNKAAATVSIIKALPSGWIFKSSDGYTVEISKFTNTDGGTEEKEDAFKNLLCINHGYNISFDKVKEGDDIYTADGIFKDKNKALWLIDNFYLAENTDENTQNTMRENLKKLLKETKKYNDADVDNIVNALCVSPESDMYFPIYCIEQAVLWKYTINNEDTQNGGKRTPVLDDTTNLIYKDESNSEKKLDEIDGKYKNYKYIYEALYSIAESKGGYESPNKDKKLESILKEVTLNNGTVDLKNNQVTYDVSVPDGYTFSDLVSSSSYDVTINNQSVGADQYSVETNNDKIVLKFKSENLAGKSVKLKMNMNGIVTEGVYIANQEGKDHQNLISIKKNVVTISTEATATSEISGTYHMNIVKKSTTDDSELSDKSKALGGTTFTVSKKVYGQTEEKKEVTTEEGKASSSIFGNVDIDKDGIGANKPDEYRIEETNTTEGYENIDLSNIVIYVYKKALQEKYVIDYVRIDKDGKEIGHANSGEGKNAEQKFDINDDGVYDIGLEVSDDGVAFGITIRNTQKEGKYNVKLIKTDLLGNPLTEKETVFSINGEDQTTVDGEVEIATEKEITEDGQKDEYKIKETSAPEGYELYTGEIALTAVGKEFEKSLALDEEATKLTVNNEELPQGETSKDGYVTWSLDGDTITIKVKNSYFDLALRKWVTQAIVTENGQTVVTETGHKAEDNPEDVVKVDLRKSKLNDVTVKFKYSIRITNEGEIAGEATEIRDDIPKGLKFVAEDNPDWREENGQIVTDKLAGTTLKTGESAEVEIILTWINSEDNLGVLINTAEINKDHNEYGVPDRDSTPGNNVPGEDDIDDAPVMVTIKTGSEIALYIAIALGTTMILVSGIVMIKKKVLINWE